MNDVVSSQSLEGPPRRPARCLKLAVVVALCVGGLTSVAYHELRTACKCPSVLKTITTTIENISPSLAEGRLGGGCASWAMEEGDACQT